MIHLLLLKLLLLEWGSDDAREQIHTPLLLELFQISTNSLMVEAMDLVKSKFLRILETVKPYTGQFGMSDRSKRSIRRSSNLQFPLREDFARQLTEHGLTEFFFPFTRELLRTNSSLCASCSVLESWQAGWGTLFALICTSFESLEQGIKVDKSRVEGAFNRLCPPYPPETCVERTDLGKCYLKLLHVLKKGIYLDCVPEFEHFISKLNAAHWAPEKSRIVWNGINLLANQVPAPLLKVVMLMHPVGVQFLILL